MSADGVEVACTSCGDRFSATLNPGLVRCAPCEDRLAPRFPAAGTTTVVLDTPGEAWA